MTGPTWFITGASSGFGRELARQVLEAGGRVFATVRDPACVDDLRQAYGPRLGVGILDVTDADAIRQVVPEAFAWAGTIDFIVNNAGYGLFGVVESLTSEQIRHQIQTNLMGPIEITRTVLPYLRTQGHGHIIAMSSYGGQAVHPGASLYHASKWGLEGFFESLSAEVSPFGIGVTIVEPGGTRTGFRDAAARAMGTLPAGYEGAPVAQLLGRLSDPAAVPGNDPIDLVRRMRDAVQSDTPPLRLVLGDDAQAIIDRALSDRLAAHRDEVAARRD